MRAKKFYLINSENAQGRICRGCDKRDSPREKRRDRIKGKERKKGREKEKVKLCQEEKKRKVQKRKELTGVEKGIKGGEGNRGK